MATESKEIKKINERIASLKDWLKSNAPECGEQQLHLVEGSQERAYWHHGYLIALNDVMRLLSGQPTSNFRYDKPDTSHSSLPV